MSELNRCLFLVSGRSEIGYGKLVMLSRMGMDGNQDGCGVVTNREFIQWRAG